MIPTTCLSAGMPGRTDKDPSLARGVDGCLWVAWQSYRDGEDRIMARRLSHDGTGPLLEVSQERGTNTRPAVATSSDGTVWVAWSAGEGERWRILARPIHQGAPGPVSVLAQSTSLLYRPSAVADATGAVWVAWHGITEGQHVVSGCRFEDGRWSQPAVLSSGPGEHYRPVLCPADAGAWLAYEKREGPTYDLYLRRWSTQGLSEPTRFSLTASWELAPSLVPDGQKGLWAAWVASHDVMDDRGIVDHKVEVMAAHFDGQRWAPYRSPDRTKPEGYVTHLYDGLLGRHDYWGFLGWRRRPQLARVSGQVWVVYERKEDESTNRHGPDALLHGTPLTGAGRGRTFEVARGHYAYILAGAAHDHEGGIPFAAQTPEPELYGAICAGELELNQSRPVRMRPPSLWRRWQPISLPEPQSLTERPSIQVGGKTYHLFWGDTHCHGSFSGDAEGELDENYTYGRYKGGLDFMAVADNDAIYDSALTPSEWAVMRAEAAHFHEPGRFVTFSAYERTAVELLRPSDERPKHNHRTILFPRDEGPLTRYTEPDAETLEGFVERLRETEAFVYAHHPEWRLAPSPRLGGVEVCSGWDAYLLISDFVPQALRAGQRLAFVGSSDSHRIVPGLGGALTGVWAERLTREAIFEALWARRCFATNGERLLLDVRLNGVPMGSEVKANSGVTVQCRVQAPRPIMALTLLRDGRTADRVEGNGPNLEVSFRDEPATGLHSYYVQVQLAPLPRRRMRGRGGNLQVAHGDYAWSSPSWAQVG